MEGTETHYYDGPNFMVIGSADGYPRLADEVMRRSEVRQ
jgi:hypothetical protein